MERDNRLVALNQLLEIAASNGYVTFDDIMRCADDNSLSIGEFDWLSETAGTRNVIIYDEAPKTVNNEEDDYDDYAQIDYERTFVEAVEMCPELEPVIDSIRNIMPPQRGEVGRLKYQVQEGNVHARERMTEMYLRLAVRIAVSRARTFDLDLAETVGDAFVGLLMAVDKYDPDGSGPFISFASLWIYQNISREQSTRNPNLYFPVHQKERFYTMYPLLKARGCTECEKFIDCSKAVNMICQKVQCGKEQARDVITASLSCLSWSDLLEGANDYPCLLDSGEEMTEKIDAKFRAEYVWKMLDCLTERQKSVLIDCFGLKDGKKKTLAQIGQELNLTRERIRQIELKALRKLYAKFGKK